MKKYRLIKVRNPRLRLLRYNLRRFLLHLFYEKSREIRRAMDRISGDKSLSNSERYSKRESLRREWNALIKLKEKTPLYCKGCGRSNLDMIYHVGMKVWFCELCY
ncbi:MAG: hypothetical protein ACTSQ8_20060, partial [Candidatus Helarchaeota archaeon]